MTYSHGRQWKEGDIEAGIYEAMVLLDIDRMPTRAELHHALGDSSLYNKIAKTGGFAHWSKKLNLAEKSSDSSKGWKYEIKMKELIESRCSLCAELTSVKHPYDIYAGVGVKIDVKASKIYRSGTFIFRLEKVPPTCDFYVLVCVSSDSEDVYIVPSILLCRKQLNFRQANWAQFKDAWHLLNQHSNNNEFYKKLEQSA